MRGHEFGSDRTGRQRDGGAVIPGVRVTSAALHRTLNCHPTHWLACSFLVGTPRPAARSPGPRAREDETAVNRENPI